MAPGRFEWDFRFFKLILVINGWGIFCGIATWMPLDLTVDKLKLVNGNGLVLSGNITSTNVDSHLCRHVTSPGHNELNLITGTRPTNGIAIEFEYSSLQYAQSITKTISLWSVEHNSNQSTANFGRIPNSIEMSLVGRAPRLDSTHTHTHGRRRGTCPSAPYNSFNSTHNRLLLICFDISENDWVWTLPEGFNPKHITRPTERCIPLKCFYGISVIWHSKLMTWNEKLRHLQYKTMIIVRAALYDKAWLSCGTHVGPLYSIFAFYRENALPNLHIHKSDSIYQCKRLLSSAVLWVIKSKWYYSEAALLCVSMGVTLWQVSLLWRHNNIKRYCFTVCARIW